MPDRLRLLFIRLGAFGDIIHALPAAASLKRSMPGIELVWAVDPKWQWLLQGNRDVDKVLPIDRRSAASVRSSLQFFRERPCSVAVDVQGLLKSAIIGRICGARRRWGFAKTHLRERLAGLLYTDSVHPSGRHVVDWNLELAAAAGASKIVIDFPLPAGKPEGTLPDSPFVLAAPFAGWKAKQWPIEHYAELASLLKKQTGHLLVLNVAGGFDGVPGTHLHRSGLLGLLDATRRAAAVVGLDSGPLHLAAALGKPGVALFGPTDPARNGPYGDTIRVLRDSNAPTTYKRIDELLPCMRDLSPGMVFEHLLPCLTTASPNPTPTR